MSPEERKKTTPRTVMFGGKAFATYTNAKRIVKLVNDVGAVVNEDPEISNYLKVQCSKRPSIQYCNLKVVGSNPTAKKKGFKMAVPGNASLI